MRDVSSLDPMWEPETPRAVRGKAFVRAAARLAKVVAPFVVTWAEGMKPQLRFGWGSTEYHLRRDGIAAMRRRGPGFEDNPRSNYNERLKKRQERAARAPEAAPAPSEEPASAEEPAASVEGPASVEEPASQAEDAATTGAALAPKPALDFSEAALQKAVHEAMGGSGATEATEPITDPDQLKATLVQVRASLQALDDVKDWSAVETLDDELYKLHRAVEYKMRNHKASEAKSKLDDLFK